MCYTFPKIKSLKDSKQTYEKPKLQSCKEQKLSCAEQKKHHRITRQKVCPGKFAALHVGCVSWGFECYPRNAHCGRGKQACPDTTWWQWKTWFPVSKPVVRIPTWMNIYIHSQTLTNSPSMKCCWYVIHSDCHSTTKHTSVCTATNYTQKMRVTYKKYPNDHNRGTQQNNVSNCSLWVHQRLETTQLTAQLVTDPWPALTEALRFALSWTSTHRPPRAC